MEIADYEKVLGNLPGVKSFKLVTDAGHSQDRGFDGWLRLETEAGRRELWVQLLRSHLTHRTADHIVAAAVRRAEPIVLFAPHIGARLAAKLSEARINYVDANGNCHIEVAPLFLHVEGKSRAGRAPAAKGLRSAGYQVLFVYLAEADLLNAPLRTVANVAGVSRQPVADMRHRLLDEGYVLSTKTEVRWHPRRRQEALSLWLHGYETTVRPSLLWGTYRTQDASPLELEKRLAQVFDQTEVSEFRWGGSAAGFRLTGHYRGNRTVVHLHATPGDFQKRLRAMTDPRGNLVVMDAFGELNWGPDTDTVHPLLVYSEMLNDGSERAREAAQDLYEIHLLPTWGEER